MLCAAIMIENRNTVQMTIQMPSWENGFGLSLGSWFSLSRAAPQQASIGPFLRWQNQYLGRRDVTKTGDGKQTAADHKPNRDEA